MSSFKAFRIHDTGGKISAGFEDLTLSGVWRALKRCRLGLRSGVVQQYSPDPDYISKRDNLIKCMNEAVTAPHRVALVFIDEMG